MLGEQIRRVRKQFGYTLQELSAKTNLSVGYLSNVERGISSPTIDILDIICNALRMDVVELLKADRSPSPLMKRSERRKIYTDVDGMLENVAAENDWYRCTCYTMARGFHKSVTLPDGGAESILCYLLSGVMELTMNGVTYRMEPGDTVMIPPRTPHSFCQVGAEQVSCLWFYAKSEQG